MYLCEIEKYMWNLSISPLLPTEARACSLQEITEYQCEVVTKNDGWENPRSVFSYDGGLFVELGGDIILKEYNLNF